MSKILQSLSEFFKAEGWTALARDGDVLRLIYQGAHGQYVCVAQALEDQNIALFYSYAPVNVPETKRTALTRYLNQLNYDIALGNFEMKFEDGSVRYRTSVRIEHGRLTPALAKPLVYVNLQAIDACMPALLAAIYSA